MAYKSCAQWPGGTMNGYENDITTDEHPTLEAAESICEQLRNQGFGGDYSVFPINTWVEPV